MFLTGSFFPRKELSPTAVTKTKDSSGNVFIRILIKTFGKPVKVWKDLRSLKRPLKFKNKS